VTRIRSVLLACAAAVSVTQPLPAYSQSPLPDGVGRDKFVALCSNCHEIGVVIAQGRSRSEWGDMISTMIDRGAVVPDEDFAVIQSYLERAFPPKAAAGTQSASGGRDELTAARTR
jgi:hypothetical protein